MDAGSGSRSSSSQNNRADLEQQVKKREIERQREEARERAKQLEAQMRRHSAMRRYALEKYMAEK